MSELNENGGAAMHVEWEKTRVNLWHVGAIVIATITNASAVTLMYANLTAADERNAQSIVEIKDNQSSEKSAREKRSLETDAKFARIEDKIPEIQRLDDKITRLTELMASTIKANEETNKRIDRVVESQNGKLDTIIERQAQQTSEIRVIQSQLSNNRMPQRTQMPVLRGH